MAASYRYSVCTVGCVEYMGWQHVIGMVCVLLAVLSAWCGSMFRYSVCTVGCVECMGWQHVIGMVRVLLAVLSAWGGSMLQVQYVYCWLC